MYDFLLLFFFDECGVHENDLLWMCIAVLLSVDRIYLIFPLCRNCLFFQRNATVCWMCVREPPLPFTMSNESSLYAYTYNQIWSTSSFFPICIGFVIEQNHAHVCVAPMKIFVYWFYSHAQWKFIHGPQMHTLKPIQQFPNVRSSYSIFVVISFRSLRIVYGNPRNSIAQNVMNSFSICSYEVH